MPRLVPTLVLALTTACAMGCARRPAEVGGRGIEARGLPSVGEPLPGMLPFYYDLYTFRGDTGTTAVVASFAVRVGRLEREHVRGGYRYRFNVTLALADTVRGGVSRTDDSVFVTVPRPLGDEHLLHAVLETEAQPSTTTVERAVMIDAPHPGTGQLYTHPYVIPDYSGTELMLSDVALGLPDRDGGWERGEATLALLPSDHFPGGAFDVYYEIYNLPRGNRYTTEIAIEPVTRSGTTDPDRSMRVRFSGQSSPDRHDVMPELRSVQAPLSDGRYRLTVTVTDLERDIQVGRSRLLRIEEWEEDATLVPTCPVGMGARSSRRACEPGS